VTDPAGAILLLRASDPGWPEQGLWWEVPGGGIEPGEDVVAAACREVREETGVVVPAAAVGPVQWRGEVTYSWLGRRYWSEQLVCVARLTAAPQLVAIGRTDAEQATFSDVCWLPVDDLAGGRLFPDLATVAGLLAGAVVDAGFSVWC